MAEKDEVKATPETVILGLEKDIEVAKERIAILEEENGSIPGLSLKISDLETKIEELEILLNNADAELTKWKSKKNPPPTSGGIPVQEH